MLSLVVADELYRRFPEADEGDLSRLRSPAREHGEPLAQIGAGTRHRRGAALGSGELKTGGFRRESILADAFEALCGAVYLDAGLEAARQLVLRLYAPRMLDALELARR